MKWSIINRMLIFVFFCGAATMSQQRLLAQSIPGIYGGAPSNELGTYRYVELESASGDNYIVPLNGILNYVALYVQVDNGNAVSFIPGGTYSVYYLNSSQQIVGSAGTVTYSPNSGYTNGVEVSQPNPGANGPLGIQGTAEGQNGNALAQASVVLYNSSNQIVADAITNGDGFFSLYYSTKLSIGSGFVPPGTYTLQIQKQTSMGGSSGCSIVFSDTLTTSYVPSNSTNPSSSTYYVSNATDNLGALKIAAKEVCP